MSTEADRDLAGLTALVLDAEAKSGPTVVRALGRGGAEVIVAATTARPAPAQRSRHAAARLTQPHALYDPEGLLAWLDELVHARRPDVVVAQTDYTIRLLDKARKRFEGRTALALPPHDAIEVCYDKSRLLELAERLGIPIPRTWRPNGFAELPRLAPKLPYPVYVKARQSYDTSNEKPRFARGRFAHDPDTLLSVYRKLHDASPLPLIQEAICGPIVDVDGVWRQGRRGPLFCHRAHREWPISGGYGTIHESIPPAEAPVAEADALLGAVGWTSVAQVEFIQDSRDGVCRLLEVNGRFWGSLEFAHHCGVPIAADTVRVALGQDPSETSAYREEAWGRWLEGDLKRLFTALTKRRQVQHEVLRMPGRLEALADIVTGLRPRVHSENWHLDDPMPYLADRLGLLSRAWRGTDPGQPWGNRGHADSSTGSSGQI